jgi:hypothetical protein
MPMTYQRLFLLLWYRFLVCVKKHDKINEIWSEKLIIIKRRLELHHFLAMLTSASRAASA